MSELAEQYNAEVVRRLQAEAERDALARQYDDNLARLINAEALTGQPTTAECCASGRCEVCSPGYDWGRDG